MYVLAPGPTAMFLVSDVRETLKVVPVPPFWTQSFVNATWYLQSSSRFSVPMLGSGSISTPASPAVSPPSNGSFMQAPTSLYGVVQSVIAIPAIGPPPIGHAPPSFGMLPGALSEVHPVAKEAAAHAKPIARQRAAFDERERWRSS